MARRTTTVEETPGSVVTKTRTEIREARTDATLATVESYYGPAVVVIKRIGWRALEDAAAAQMRDGLRTVREIGGVEAVRQFKEIAEANRQDGDERPDTEVVRDVVAAAKDPLLAYDKQELVMRSVVTVDGQEKTLAQIEEFEPEVLTAIATAVLRLARPGLFETEEERKNA